MKKFILFFPIVLLANSICFDLKNNEKLLNKYKSFHSDLKNSAKLLEKKLYFAKKYDNSDKDIVAKIGAIEALYDAYRNNLLKKYSPDDKVIKSFYIDNKEAFKESTLVNTSTIKVFSVDLADKIYNILKKEPKKFEELAKKHSLDKQIYFTDIPLANFSYKVREAIRVAKEHDILEPIKVGNYIYINRIDKKIKKDPSFKNLKPEIKKILVNIYVNKLMDKMYEEDEWGLL